MRATLTSPAGPEPARRSAEPRQDSPALLTVGPSPLHGLGCFALRDIAAGEVISRCRFLAVTPRESEHLMRTNLKNYVFYLKDGDDEDGPYHCAVAMGPISFCNHSAEASCDFALSEEAGEITLTARRSIARGEELTIDYGDYAETIL